MPEGWEDELLLARKEVGPNLIAKVTVKVLSSGHMRGHLFVTIRQARRSMDDFSAGLVYQDLAGHTYNLVRCNGPHPQVHENRWPRGDRFAVIPHVHHLTEFYQRKALQRPGQVSGDHFALPTALYRSLPGALDVLARKVHIVSQARLFSDGR